MERVTLHRCPVMFLKSQGHACWRVQSALDDQGIPYDLVKVPVRKSKRERVVRLTGERVVPVIEFADGTAYREESKDMAARIRAGKLFEGRTTPP